MFTLINKKNIMYDYNTIKQKIFGYEEFIKNFFKKNGKDISSIKKLEKELLEKEFGNETEKYNQKTEEFNNYMLDREQELREIEDKKRQDKEKLDTVSKKLQKNLELLEEENISLEEINSNLNEYKSILLNFGDNFSKNTKKIDELVDGIVNYENIAIDEIKEILEKSKNDINNFFEEEKEKITKFLEEKSKKVIEDKFNIEKLKLDEEKREIFHFDLRLFFKYIILFGLVFGIATIDFLLVQHIVEEEFDLGRNTENATKFLVNYIIPLLPSFVLIFGEFIVRKYLKNLKFLVFLVHTFSIITIIFILFTVFFTYNDFSFSLVDSVNMYDLLSRILIFVIAIPVVIAILEKKFKTDEFFDFLKQIFRLLFFPFIALKLFLESFILKNRKNKLFKESYIFDINLENVDLFIKKDHKLDKLFSIPRTFNEDLNQVSIKTEKALANIKDLQAFLSKDIENSAGKIINSKIERLKEDIVSIGKNILEQEELIDKKYQKEIDTINENIKKVKENRKIYKYNYEQNRKIVENAISDSLIQLK